MKALAIDSAVTRFCIAVKNNDATISTSFNIGMKQSETLLVAIDELIKKASISVQELDYTVLCAGPGSFTGLRLAYSALKALTLAHDIPLYAINTLSVYAQPYKNVPFPVLSVIDAKKNKFYIAGFFNGKEIIPSGDYTILQVLEKIANYFEENLNATVPPLSNERPSMQSVQGAVCSKNVSQSDTSSYFDKNVGGGTICTNQVLCCGPDAKLFSEKINMLVSECGKDKQDGKSEQGEQKLEFGVPSSFEKNSASLSTIFFPINFSCITTDSLFTLAEEKIAKGEKGSEDYDGPIYLRASEAEENLAK